MLGSPSQLRIYMYSDWQTSLQNFPIHTAVGRAQSCALQMAYKWDFVVIFPLPVIYTCTNWSVFFQHSPSYTYTAVVTYGRATACMYSMYPAHYKWDL